MSKVANLSSFIASKKDAAPAPLEAERPAPPKPAAEVPPPVTAPEPVPATVSPAVKARKGRGVAQPEAAPADVRAVLNVRVDPTFRKSLKVYAARMGIDMSEIIREGVELYRKKHGEPPPD